MARFRPDRREFFLRALAVAGTGLAGLRRDSLAQSMPAGKQVVRIAEFDSRGRGKRVTKVERISKTDAEWRRLLSPEVYNITRLQGTEAAFTGKYYNNRADGLYRCLCCGTALFDSRTQFDSGTGWPSFWAAMAKENVVVAEDEKCGTRCAEIRCARCDAHLGHVFDDGPPPTGLRYCMNSAALVFRPRGDATK